LFFPAILAASLFAQVAPVPLVPGAKVVTLWPAGAATLKGLDEKEVFTITPGMSDRVQKVVNVHNPSIELHLAPAGKANGVGIILAAGGGNTSLNVGTEGTDIATWLNSLGISTFILRYRLRPYNSAVDALSDTQRSFRIIRANAKEWRVDPGKIGIMGFSAGGEQAARVSLNFDAGNPGAADPIEKQSDRPDFAVLVYAGWGQFDLTQVPKNAPPAFLTSAGLDDAFTARKTVEFYNALFDAKIPVELHIYAHGGHANGIKPRGGIPFGTWQFRFLEWLNDLEGTTPGSMSH
jgi:endo-1,4-beta-xylanase